MSYSQPGIILTPIYNTPTNNYGIGSMLKTISFLLLFIGIIFITMGYSKQQGEIPPKVEYRYVPRTFEEENASSPPLLSVFGNMFSDRGPWQKLNGYVDTYPWQTQLINSKVVLPYNNPMSGLNRAVGQKIIGPGLNENKDAKIEVNKEMTLRKYGPRGQGTRPLG
jgi:hypothetical protein